MSLKPDNVHVYHVFLASPGDVGVERQHVRRFFDDYNRHTAHLWNARFQVVDWENYATIGVGRPQELITQQTLEKFKDSLALVVGIMAQRFGTPSGKAESGTEEEFNHAKQFYDAHGVPEIKWFFRKIDKLELPADPDQEDKVYAQWKLVRAFRKRMQDLHNPVFFTEYPGPEGFARVFDHDLNLWLNDASRPWAKHRAASGRTAIAGELPVEFNSERYRAALLKRFDGLNFEMLDSTGAYYSGVRLWSVFVPQSARECHQYNPRLLEIPKEHQQRLLKSGEIDAKELADAQEQSEKLRQEYFQQPLLPVLEIVDQALQNWSSRDKHRLVILGDPGSGKSSLIRYLALRWAKCFPAQPKAEGPSEHRDSSGTQQEGHVHFSVEAFSIVDVAMRDTQPIPLVIELGAYARWKCDGRKGFVRFLEEAPVWHDWPRGLLGQLLAQPHRMVLLLDGLDEIFDPQLREAVVNDIQRFSTEHAQTPIVVTSRIVGYQSQRLSGAEFRHFMLQDLDTAQIDTFLERWHEQTFDDPAQAAPKHERLKRAIRESKAIGMLAGNPLLLTMMAILNRNQELPRDRVDLYAQATRLLLHQWDTEHSLTDFPGLSADIGWREKHDILRRVASFMQAGPSGLKGNMIDGPTLMSLIEVYLHDELNFPQSKAAARAVVEHLRQRNFILCFVGADSYGFVHRTFLEYFCAADLVHQFNVAKTLDEAGLLGLFDQHCREDDWREVLRLICGQIDESFVGKIVIALVTNTQESDSVLDEFEFVQPELPLAIYCLCELRTQIKQESAGRTLFQTIMSLLSMSHDEFKSSSADSDIRLVGSSADSDVRLVGSSTDSDVRLVGSSTDSDVRLVGSSTDSDVLFNWPEDLPLNFVVNEILPACKELGSRWPGIEDLIQNAASSMQSLNVRWYVHWFEIVRSIFMPRSVCLEFTACAHAVVRELAMKMLILTWPDESTGELLRARAVEDENADIRRVALDALVEKWPDESTGELLRDRAVEDENSGNRRVALEALVEKWPGESTGELLLACAVNEQNPANRREMLVALAKKCPDESVAELLRARIVEDKDENVRRAALSALVEKWSVESTKEFLSVRIIEDQDDNIRRAALRVLVEKWPDESTGEILRSFTVKDQNPYLRREALEALMEKWADESTAELFRIRAVEDQDQSVRGCAFSIFWGMHSQFGKIVATRDLDGRAPYLDPRNFLSLEHIQFGAERAGIAAGDLEAQIASLNQHLGWDITIGARPGSAPK